MTALPSQPEQANGLHHRSRGQHACVRPRKAAVLELSRPERALQTPTSLAVPSNHSRGSKAYSRLFKANQACSRVFLKKKIVYFRAGHRFWTAATCRRPATRDADMSAHSQTIHYPPFAILAAGFRKPMSTDVNLCQAMSTTPGGRAVPLQRFNLQRSCRAEAWRRRVNVPSAPAFAS
jgi:hypothetical protein